MAYSESSENEKCLLEEYKELNEHNKQDLAVINQWRLALLPFLVALYGFALKMQNPYLSLFGSFMSAIAINQCLHRLRDVIARDSYILVFIEEETRFLRWRKVRYYDLGMTDTVTAASPESRRRKGPIYTSVLYFTFMGFAGILISALYWIKFEFGLFELIPFSALVLFLLVKETLRFAFCPRSRERLIEDYRRRKSLLADSHLTNQST